MIMQLLNINIIKIIMVYILLGWEEVKHGEECREWYENIA